LSNNASSKQAASFLPGRIYDDIRKKKKKENEGEDKGI